jgi:uncharacterized membrane protein YebE (DUF533 family)
MKNLASLVVSGLALVGIGTVGYRAYKLKQAEKAEQEKQVVEVVVEATDDTRK